MRLKTYRLFGFTASLLLTLMAYFIIVGRESFHLNVNQATILILFLAGTQASAQFFFFMDLWREKKTFWNISTFVSTLIVVFIIVAFSIWIMGTLNYKMMPQHNHIENNT